MSIISLSSCKTIYHKITTWDGDYMRKAVITEEKIRSIEPGKTRYSEVRNLFDSNESNKWTYRKPFWITWEGERYKVDQALTYLQVIEFSPEDLGGMMVYAWKERRVLRVYLYKGVVQLYSASHTVRDRKLKEFAGPMDNYDADLLDLETMNGLGCDRDIYDVVSLGREAFDPEEFEKYCRPLIIEE